MRKKPKLVERAKSTYIGCTTSNTFVFKNQRFEAHRRESGLCIDTGKDNYTKTPKVFETDEYKPELLIFTSAKQVHRDIIQKKIFSVRPEFDISRMSYERCQYVKRLLKHWDSLGPLRLDDIECAQKGRFDGWRGIKYETELTIKEINYGNMIYMGEVAYIRTY